MNWNGWVRNRLVIRIAAVVMVVIIVLSTGYTWLQISNTKNSAMQVITSYGMHIGESYLQTMDVERLETFLADPEENELYWTIREELDQFRTQIGAMYVFIVRFEDANSLIMIDGQPRGSDSASAIGEETVIKDKELQQLQKGEAASSGITEDPLYGTYISSYSPIRNEAGTVVAVLGIDTDVSYLNRISQDMVSENMKYYVLMALVALLGIGIVVWVLHRALRPLKWIIIGAENIAEGNFEQADRYLQSNPVRTRDEISEMHKVIISMSSSLKAMVSGVVSNIAHISEQVVSSSDRLSKESGHLLQLNAQVHEASSEVAAGASAQYVSADDCARSMEEITLTVQRITEASQTVSDASVQALSHAETGRTMVDEMNMQMRAIALSTDRTGQRVHDLNHYSQEIEETLASIAEISSQTRLLALNASIEAARAGEHGAGFAVVAGEVRKLADYSSTSTNRIAELLQNVQQETQHIREAIESTAHDVQAGEVLSDRVQASLADIVDTFRMVNVQLQEVTAATEQASAGSEEITASVANIAHIAQVSSERMRHIQDQTNQQLQIVKKVADSATVLNDATHQLQASVKHIQI